MAQVETKPDETKVVTPAASPAGSAAVPQSYRVGDKEYASADELVKAHEHLNSELGKRSTELDTYKRQLDETSRQYGKWQQWWTDVAPYWGPEIDAYLVQKAQRLINGQAAPAQVAQPQQMNGATRSMEAAGYDFLKPEDVQKFRMDLFNELGTAYRTHLGQILAGIDQALQAKEKYYQSYLTNHLSLLRRAMERKMQDPTFDVDAVMEQAVKAIGGQVDPIQLGQQLLDAATFQQKIDQARKEAYESGKKDYEQELKNKQQETVPAISSATPMKVSSPMAAPGSIKNLDTLRHAAAENIIKKFGAGVFTG